ncbi:MAG TPA: hypothetical protein VMV29_02140 [Ktedonobacterales bacterium]|nr:hypothetical protein [Ktedonobacterales bacterium]
MTTMKRVLADFNSLASAPVDLVKLAAPGSWQEAQLPPLQHGERVILYDFDGVEVEATVIHDEQGWWLAAPDGATWRDTLPQASPLPTLPTALPLGGVDVTR